MKFKHIMHRKANNLGESNEVPIIGDVIRTKKMQMEGEVTKIGKSSVGYDEVYFRVADGRVMKTPLSNVIVIEKLADDNNVEEGSMGGINRSAPAVDVSYEKTLDKNPKTAHSRVVGEDVFNEVMNKWLGENSAQERVDVLEVAVREAQQITKQIRYDNTPSTIITEMRQLLEKYSLDPSEIEYHQNNIRDAQNALESAIYGLEEIFTDALYTARTAVENEEDNLEEAKDPCWDGYKKVGMKNKGKKQVPNCVPK